MNSKRITTIVYNTIVVICLVIGTAFVVCQFTHFGNIEFTDNARVCQYVVPQNTRVQGFIREIRFEEYQEVKKGDTLVIIEDAEFRLRLAQAEADLSRAEQGMKASGTSITTTQSNISATDASIEEAKVNFENAKREDERFKTLLAKDAVTRQEYDNVHTAFLAAEARYHQVQQSRSALTSVKEEQGHHHSASEASLQLARAAVELARLNLSYCYIIATSDGHVGAKDIQVGQLVNPGQTLLNIIDSSDMWVEANYKESQLTHIALGANVKMKADAVPGTVYYGKVERISDATGSVFSQIPIDNATGNFVKVEQRVTVRIKLDKTADLSKLHSGYNMECEVAYE